jgi:hypothetical protein
MPRDATETCSVEMARAAAIFGKCLSIYIRVVGRVKKKGGGGKIEREKKKLMLLKRVL